MSRFQELSEEGRQKDPKTVSQEILSLSRDPRFSSVLEALRLAREGWINQAVDPGSVVSGTQPHYVGGIAAIDQFAARIQTIIDERRGAQRGEEPPEGA